MAINYSVTPRKNPKNPQDPAKYYAHSFMPCARRTAKAECKLQLAIGAVFGSLPASVCPAVLKLRKKFLILSCRNGVYIG